MAAAERPAQPKSILRGHKASIHAAAFVRANERLLTGDADGFVVAWDLTILRPRAVWQAHSGAILGLDEWDPDRVITHGRDNKLIVWKLGVDDEGRLSTRPPLEPSTEPHPQPWVLHVLDINTMNFCSFSQCAVSASLHTSPAEILVAVPNTLASEAIDIFHLPSQERRHTVKLGEKNGMVMALSLFHLNELLTVAAGYENGIAIVAQLNAQSGWTIEYQAQRHTQPILSLDLSPEKDFFVTSSADALIVKHPLTIPQKAERISTPQLETITDRQDDSVARAPAGTSLLSAALASASTPPQTTNAAAGEARVSAEPLQVVNTKHSGQQSLRIRSDGRVFATAGWDFKVRVYSARTLKEVAVLKWHQAGCYALAFAHLSGSAPDSRTTDNKMASHESEASTAPASAETSIATVPKLAELSVRDKRLHQAKTAHWLAAGSKDGKVSLWDVF